MSGDSVTVAENEYWRIKIFFPPREHPPSHVHLILKKKKAVEMIVFLSDFSFKIKGDWSKTQIKAGLSYVFDKREFLKEIWELRHEK